MSENGGMQALRQQVQNCPSGARLAAALEGASLANSDIPALITAVIGEKLAAGAAAVGGKAAAGAAAGGAQPPAARLSLDDALCVIDGLMFLNPRGKQQLALFGDRMVVKTAKADIAVPWAAIKHVAIIDSIPKDTKGKVLLYLHIDSEKHQVMNGKTALTAVVIQTTADAHLDVAHPQGAGRLQGPAPVVLCQALGLVPNGVDTTSFVSPDAAYFQSAGQATGVGAHVKAKEGFLYPLPSALCFLESPALFIPHASIRSVELMRAGGASSTFDLVVHLRSGRQHEFGFIAREEVAGIEDYIRKCRLVTGAAESSEGEGEEEEEGGSQAEAGAEEEDSDDPEDEDFNPSSSSDEEEEGQEQPQQSGASKRKRGGSAGADGSAADAAGEAEGSSDEEDEDEDEEEEGSSEEEDEEEEEGSVELVSEDDFSTGQLQSMMQAEGGGRRAKRQRT